MRKARNSKKAEIAKLTEALMLNGEALRTERVQKFTHHDLLKLAPITPAQVEWFKAAESYDYLVANGSAGTGKTIIALYSALQSVIVKRTHVKIMVVRSAVPCRDIGFLPGSVLEKLAAYELPYHSLCHELLGRLTAYEHLKKAGIIEFHPTSFMRGVTLNDAIVVLEEAQNMTFEEISTIVTRLGDNSKLFVCADAAQTDLKKNESGYLRALRIWESMSRFKVITFGHDDIVRSDVVKEWIIKSECL